MLWVSLQERLTQSHTCRRRALGAWWDGRICLGRIPHGGAASLPWLFMGVLSSLGPKRVSKEQQTCVETQATSKGTKAHQCG